MTHQDDAAFIITALHDGPDLGKMGTSTISLVKLSEELRLARQWSQALGCCDQLDDLVQDLDMQNIPGLDTAYAIGMARMSRGAVHLSQGSLDEAEASFAEGRRCFQDACTRYSEAVALLALALVHQARRQWTRALGTLQPSLTILKQLGDPLKDRVLEILTDVQESLKTDLKQGMATTDRAVPPGSPTPSPPGAPAPTPVPLYPSRTSPSRTRQRQSKVIPLLGRIAAGEPILADGNFEDHIVVDEETADEVDSAHDDIEDYAAVDEEMADESGFADDNIEDYIAIDEEMADEIDFALRVNGYSMIKAAILEGDIVLMQSKDVPPPNGQIAAVIIPQMDNEATLKRFYQERDHIRLGPANDNYPIIIVKPDSVPEEEIRIRYDRTHPKRHLQIYSGTEPQIAGWARGLIREQIKITEEMKYQP